MTTEEKVDWREIGEINVQNSLLLVSKLFKINGWDEQSNSEAVELLRPLFIHLDRHKNKSITQAREEERERVGKIEENYQELIMAVEKKYEGETRHETALKYIRNAEANDYGEAKSSLQDNPDKE